MQTAPYYTCIHFTFTTENRGLPLPPFLVTPTYKVSFSDNLGDNERKNYEKITETVLFVE